MRPRPRISLRRFRHRSRYTLAAQCRFRRCWRVHTPCPHKRYIHRHHRRGFPQARSCREDTRACRHHRTPRDRMLRRLGGTVHRWPEAFDPRDTLTLRPRRSRQHHNPRWPVDILRRLRGADCPDNAGSSHRSVHPARTRPSPGDIRALAPGEHLAGTRGCSRHSSHSHRSCPPARGIPRPPP